MDEIEVVEGWDLFASIEDASAWKIKRAGLTMPHGRWFEILYRDRTSIDVAVTMVDADGNERAVECYFEDNGHGSTCWIVNL